MHKATKKTLLSNTGVYSTESFKILHPHRDDFNLYLDCDVDNNNDVVFSIIDANGGKTQAAIDCVGLAAPHLVTQRSAIILKEEISRRTPLNALVRLSIKVTRKRR